MVLMTIVQGKDFMSRISGQLSQVIWLTPPIIAGKRIHIGNVSKAVYRDCKDNVLYDWMALTLF
jgi:hypothetical protein